MLINKGNKNLFSGSGIINIPFVPATCAGAASKIFKS